MLRFLPGVAGATLVVVGVALLSVPVALVVAGGFLLLLDRRIG